MQFIYLSGYVCHIILYFIYFIELALISVTENINQYLFVETLKKGWNYQ